MDSPNATKSGLKSPIPDIKLSRTNPLEENVEIPPLSDIDPTEITSPIFPGLFIVLYIIYCLYLINYPK